MNFKLFLEMEEFQPDFYFYGHNGQTSGHYTYNKYLSSVGTWKNPAGQFLANHDDKLTPKKTGKQGEAAIHQYPGFSILAIHDYTGDSRPGSNSMFMIPGDNLSQEEVISQAKSQFPQIWARFKVPVNVVSTKIHDSLK